MPNRLARERSPYLLQHANNPVDWYPWGDEAFDAARRESRPIFLSIGYSTCHWCHVMEHESFEDPAIAAVLNRDFIAIKVDREERPDIDRVYMAFVQATTGAGGWPMSVWLTPDLEPFFGGTYFPPSSRWGRPGFIDVLTQIAGTWRSDPSRVVTSANDMTARLREATGAGKSAPDRGAVAQQAAIETGVRAFVQAFDARHGGFGGAPKFPRPSELMFLFDAYALTHDYQARKMAVDTLRAMAVGGVRDHIGGGFHRYSVDAEWRVPHFEKMLYDQAQLVLAYLAAAQVTGEDFFATVAEDTLAYVHRDLTSADGGFLSAEDADSLPADDVAAAADHAAEKREGAFYVWTAREIDTLFGEDAAVVRRRFGVEDGGNALADPQAEFVGQNILYVAQTIDDIATRTGRTVDEVMRVLSAARPAMFERREGRPRPHLDDKVITAWNGLMMAAFARAARVLVDSPHRAVWREAAVRAATAVRDRLWQPDTQRLLRRFRDGDARIDAFCEDYAFLIWGLLELFQTTGGAEWLEWAMVLQDRANALFGDDVDGGWFSTTGEDRSVLLRLKEDYDGAEPAAASVMVRNLLTLSELAGDASLRARAERALERYGPELGRVARVMPLMLSNVAHWRAAPSQIVIVGDPASPDVAALERVVAKSHRPFTVTIVATPEDLRALTSGAPWLAAMNIVGGRAAAYVCHHFACQAPVTGPEQLEQLLKGEGANG